MEWVAWAIWASRTGKGLLLKAAVEEKIKLLQAEASRREFTAIRALQFGVFSKDKKRDLPWLSHLTISSGH